MAIEGAEKVLHSGVWHTHTQTHSLRDSELKRTGERKEERERESTGTEEVERMGASAHSSSSSSESITPFPVSCEDAQTLWCTHIGGASSTPTESALVGLNRRAKQSNRR